MLWGHRPQILRSSPGGVVHLGPPLQGRDIPELRLAVPRRFCLTSFAVLAVLLLVRPMVAASLLDGIYRMVYLDASAPIGGCLHLGWYILDGI